MALFTAMALFAGVVAYTVLAGADFGAGFWDLTAGGDGERSRRLRELIERSLAPVWEANHVWLIFCLVILWTGFPGVFAAVMTTLYLPLTLAALGIVVRGSGFAFRKALIRTSGRRAAGVAFATSSVVTPFFLGTVVGGIASGRVPAGGYGDPVNSWLNPTSALIGVFAVALCAFVASLFLTAEARLAADSELANRFRRRAEVITVITGALSLAGLAVLHADADQLFRKLVTRGLPLMVVATVTGTATLLLIRRARPHLLQALAVITAAATVLGWGVAQYPNMLVTSAPFSNTAAPTATLWGLAIVTTTAVLLVVPSFGLLFVLQQKGSLQ